MMVRGKQYYPVIRYLELVQIDPSQVKWIWLRRKNKIRQAISRLRLSMMRELVPNTPHSFFDSLVNDDPPEKHDY